MEKSHNNAALIFPLAAGIMFGAVGIFVRVLTGYGINTTTVLFLRTLFASAGIFAVIMLTDKSRLFVRIKDIWIFAGTGLLGMMSLNIFYNMAVNMLTLSFAAVLLGISPVFVMIIAAFVFKEKITPLKVLCTLFMIAGCVLTGGILEGNKAAYVSVTGIIFGILAALFYALYSVFSKKASEKGYHTYTVIFYSVLFTTLALAPFADYKMTWDYIYSSPFIHIIFLLTHSLCTSVLPYIFITIGLIKTEAGIVSVIASGTEPAAALIFGIVIYSEFPSILMFIGLIIVILSISALCILPRKSPHK
ncbi:MAG: DMT family transporter [Clostridia bacterium]|nr:DMT family transporter [Clostridia bacterium]